MSGRKSFILKFNYLFHPRGGVQNPDNRVNTRRLEKLIFAWCFLSLVTWRGDVLCRFLHVSAVSRTRSTVRMEVPAGEAKGWSSLCWFNPPNCGFLSWFDICTLAIYPTADQAMNKMPVISNSMFSFPERNEIFLPNDMWKLISTEYIWLMHVLDMYSVCSLCQVKCCAWRRCERHSSCPQLACHLLTVPNHVVCPLLLFASNGIISEEILTIWTRAMMAQWICISLLSDTLLPDQSS